ncbi:MAG: rifampicin phosphotransferase [Ilumatobacteraceae bacterium]
MTSELHRYDVRGAPAPSACPLEFAAPGPGMWKLDSTHTGRRPTTYFLRELFESMFEDGSVIICERYGLPLERIRMVHVNGCRYVRPKPLGEGRRPKSPPPAAVMRLVVRMHPGLRRRNRIAGRAWQEKRWRIENEQWFDRDRAEIVTTNLALQAILPHDLDDRELVDHLDRLVAHLRVTGANHGSTHGADAMPMGDYLVHCRTWGIDDEAATFLLRGSSPASVEAARELGPVVRAIAKSGAVPTSLWDIRALGSEASVALDRWLDLYGGRLITSMDIDVPTLLERPALCLNAVLATANIDDADITPDPAHVRALVPTADRSLFDAMLDEAREGMRHRDDNSGICWSWPAGLVRRALLEVGRRLAEKGRVQEAQHACELTPAEVMPLLLHGSGPSADELAERRALRMRVEAAGPPDILGDLEPAPPVNVFPAPMARATNALLTTLATMDAAPADQPLTGSGIGTTTFCGTARVVSSSDDGLDRLEPGDVLVTPFTTPAYNSVFSLVGALVCENGGLMSHAAFLSREYGVSAVLGVIDATRLIPDGSTVEVDPANGIIRILD